MARIGLRRGVVKLKRHNPSWERIFLREKKRLDQIFGTSVHIEHVGSTAIPGIVAKPIIDIDFGISSMQKSKGYIARLQNTGYEWRPKFGRADQHLVFAKGDEIKRTHYLHLVKYNGKKWKNDLFFRDYMRTHKIQAKRYEKLKEILAKKFADNRPAYTKAKASFIKLILTKAN